MYSSESEVTVKEGVNLVEQILEQGQRLRSSMVKAILDNDPFLEKCQVDERQGGFNMEEKQDIAIEEKHKFLAYLRGECMTRNEEKKVLETFRAMSDTDIIDVTERSYHSDFSCNCDTCKEYYKHNLSCDFNHSKTALCGDRERCKVPVLNLHEQQRTEINDVKYLRNCLRYVDSLKIMVHSVVLNQEGIKKVYGTNTKPKIKLPLSVSHTYFLEYKIPYIISRGTKTKAKVDSGLDSGNFVRMCSKKIQAEAILFKQISLHEVHNLEDINLATVDIKFQVSSRTYRQKTTNILGSAKFNMNCFLNSKNLSANEELLLMLNIEAPIVIGKVKVSLELGCGQSHFGEEFLKAIRSSEEKDIYEIKHVNTEVFSDHNDEDLGKTHVEKPVLLSERMVKMTEPEKNKGSVREEEMKTIKRPLKKAERTVDSYKEEKEKLKKDDREIRVTKVENVSSVIYNNQVLFGFFCVTEAYFQEIADTYVSCNPFSNNDTLCSRIVPQSQTPLYNFQQVLPFVYDESFLNRLRDNFMVFEFWNKSERDENIGISKINLHQFYVSYRNPVIAKYLERNKVGPHELIFPFANTKKSKIKFPVIGCDWWEPICDPLSGEIYGEAQILIALGSEVQVHNLRIERGFVNETVTAKFTHKVGGEVTKKQIKVVAKPKQAAITSPNQNKSQLKQSNVGPKKESDTETKGSKTIDIGTQADIKMNTNAPKESNDFKEGENFQSISSLLKNLMEASNKNYVENSTNTEAAASSPAVAKTADLLDTLQEALTLPKPKISFKAHILIENALHLPFRKKSKTKKSRGKNAKYEEILPSTYVSFEAISDDVRLTPVVQKNKNPVWNYSCEVELPVELLTNNEKRLIFKIWKKSNTTIHPNMDTDSVIGFAGLDLTVLTMGMPNVSGWFNILDFSGKCNGQIKITVTPQENVRRHNHDQKPEKVSCCEPSLNTIQLNDNVEEPSELLSRALKRKFTELDEITQRLRLRLSHVTNDESDVSNDEFADEFERDINTLCEDDVEIDDFNEVASNFRMSTENECINNSVSGDDDVLVPTERTVDPLDRHLLESRLKLDTLFEKLALLTNSDPTQVFNSRHISGCSVSQDQADLGDSHRRNPSQEVSGSSSSTLNSCVEARLAPDGAGNK